MRVCRMSSVVVGLCPALLVATTLLTACQPPRYGPAGAAARARGGAEAAARAERRARPAQPEAPPVMVAFRASMAAWMTEEEQAEFDAISLEDTQDGDQERLRYLAADRVVRHFLPLALRAQNDPTLDEHAARLEALPPLLNRDVDMVALPVVSAAMHALERYEARMARRERTTRTAREGGAPAPRRADDAPLSDIDLGPVPVAEDEDALDVATEDAVDPLAEAALADALAEYAEAYAARHGVDERVADAAAAAASDAIASGSMIEYVVEHYGVDRQQALRDAAALYSDMADAARRRERVPRPPRIPLPPPTTPDPGATPGGATTTPGAP